MLSKKGKNHHESIPLLPKYTQRIINKHDDNCQMFGAENHVKRAICIRHKKHIRNSHLCRNEQEILVTICKYCNEHNDIRVAIQSPLCNCFYSSKLKNKEFILECAAEIDDNNNKCLKEPSRTRKKVDKKNVSKIGHFENSKNIISKSNGSDNTRKFKNKAKTASKLVAKFSNYSITLDRNVFKIEKTLQTRKPSKKFKKDFRVFPKCKKRQKIYSSWTDDLNMNEDPPNIINSHKELPNTFTANSCHCQCAHHSDIIDESALNKGQKNSAENKETPEKCTAKTSDNSCACFRKIRTIFSDIWKNVNTSIGLLQFYYNSIKKISPSSSDKKNHKKRKKKNSKEDKVDDVVEESGQISSDDSRNYRISAYLAEQDWIKRQSKKCFQKSDFEADVSEALAVIKSRSKNFAVSSLYITTRLS